MYRCIDKIKLKIMKYIDIGANLTSAKFNDNLEEILEESFNNNLNCIIITGTTALSSRVARNIVYTNSKYNLYYTIGVHPHNSKDFSKKQYENFKELIKDPKAIAVGECGLDYTRNYSNKQKQMDAFEKQISIAIEINKPLFLHERDASDDFINIMSKYQNKIRGVVHCFTGNNETLKKYLDMGLYIGITGWICDDARNSELIDAIKCIPINKLMVETDCPYLSPVIIDEINTPKNIKYVVKKIAEILNIDEDSLSNQLYDNTKYFFNI